MGFEMKRLLLVIFLCGLSACSVTTPKIGVEIMDNTTNPSSPVSPTTTPSAVPETQMSTVDLSEYTKAWNSGDINAIRSLYTADARYFSEEDLQALSDNEPIDVLVSSPKFAQQLERYQGKTMRIIDNPISVYGKLVAFTYRWEGPSDGYNGVALLRYEGNKIFLHSFLNSDQLTTNQSGPSTNSNEINLSGLMQVWKSGDSKSAKGIYSANSVILSDEDLAQAEWRDFSVPPKIDQLLSHFLGWNPVTDGTQSSVEDMAIFAWNWTIGNYPVGYGIRMVKHQESSIDIDVRYAIRPWETSGKPFMSP
jgi:hypothetical protein